jgi:carbohydrate-binding DOMON domain-containing protein
MSHNTHTHSLMHARTHTRTHTHTVTRTHIHTHMHTHMHTASSKSPGVSHRPVIGPDFDVELNPMEIRTFEVEFKFN